MEEWLWLLETFGIIVVLQISHHILRKFKVGKQIIKISGYLWWLFVVATVADFMGLSEVFSLFYLFWFLIFLNTSVFTFFQSIYQLAGILYIKIRYIGKMPTHENYTQKGEYILPFTGKWTVVNGGIDKNLQHGGGGSQTYACDVVIIDDNGNTCQGSTTDVQSYFCYAKDIIAPADGVVVQVRKKDKDTYVDGMNIYCDSTDIGGNSITIKHHENEYSHFAHLMPNSVVVNVGDKVKQGEVMAKCGNSGNTSEPHLHFQFQSGKSFFWSVGLPIAFSGINAQSKTNYNLADPRTTENNLQIIGDKIYIGRGLEVENGC